MYLLFTMGYPLLSLHKIRSSAPQHFLLIHYIFYRFTNIPSLMREEEVSRSLDAKRTVFMDGNMMRCYMMLGLID